MFFFPARIKLCAPPFSMSDFAFMRSGQSIIQEAPTQAEVRHTQLLLQASVIVFSRQVTEWVASHEESMDNAEECDRLFLQGLRWRAMTINDDDFWEHPQIKSEIFRIMTDLGRDDDGDGDDDDYSSDGDDSVEEQDVGFEPGDIPRMTPPPPDENVITAWNNWRPNTEIEIGLKKAVDAAAMAKA